ncbi:hypothetical protein [Methylobacterium brachiatum]|uniref:hypothetical protein n=1 Tax=Methylobacterium brachiatum TaxID=269660 RepID=UPI000EFC43B1|nr:hypothetical protein [Methylobacterium brachiatum]AYO86645.1 hypothetical protein EBB05_30280 [Methylobacterium brachiatum]
MTGTMFGRAGHHMSAEEAVTVRQLADLTGFPVRRIVRLINRTPLTQIRFAVAVTLATGEWDWLDGETGQWSRDGTKQQEKLQRYAASLTEAEPCTDPSFPN